MIPTLQKSARLREVVEICARHEDVLEVLVVNNSPSPLSFVGATVRVLQQERNIYVNPAWNLGAREARGALLAIINDDVVFDGEALTHAARILRRGWFGMVGPDRSTFAGGHLGQIGHRVARNDATLRFYGTFMAMRTRDYVEIPGELLIWGGDDWLIAHIPRPPAVLIRTRFETEMHSTSGGAQFNHLRASDQAAGDRLVAPLHGKRWWHEPLARWTKARDCLYRVRSRLTRR